MKADANSRVEVEREVLDVLGELLVQIRGIASDAHGGPHVSARGRGQFTPETACKAIYALAEAAHNIPNALASSGASFLLEPSLMEVSRISSEILGDRSTLNKRHSN